ncbi:2-aminoethanethiol dioxygenase-like isoform X1 [Dreissena polymorpha]|uniref:2-aminoethanethiol dioxygenase-like isoform X1 n=1 Tax=Dreissena polymorpha TaxID=45954 RepID=UPI0022642B4A|nr:2-aminoethanethiol dioxygenase-like isoform X1 [Dreissena polymorpha]
MATCFQKAIEHAFKLFTRKIALPVPIPTEDLLELGSLFNQITKEELNLSPDILHERVPGPKDPPVTYMKIIDNNVMTVSVFILRKGSRLPLHDHPGMYGFLKVIHGSVTIDTYSPLDQSHFNMPVASLQNLHQRFGRKIPAFPTRFENTRTFSAKDDCAILTPEGRNIHEIYAESGTAAFLDILAPPYCTERFSQDGFRPCTYYKEVEASVSNPSVRYIMPIPPPPEYWCDEIPYMGPAV